MKERYLCALELTKILKIVYENCQSFEETITEQFDNAVKLITDNAVDCAPAEEIDSSVLKKLAMEAHPPIFDKPKEELISLKYCKECIGKTIETMHVNTGGLSIHFKDGNYIRFDIINPDTIAFTYPPNKEKNND